ncbi:MAG: NADH dehydrogenase ubiquinone Fe-S protein 4, partial [Pseudomonadota bacterium]
MIARIFRPAKTAMQSGKGKSRQWVLQYEPSAPKQSDPLMGY